MTKLYCYVDETGQDTKGKLFIVVVIIVADKDIFCEYLEQVEKNSGKGKFKWGKANVNNRIIYIQRLLKQDIHNFKVYFSTFQSTKEYMYTTVFAIGKALYLEQKNSDAFIMYIDGLNDKMEIYYKKQLKKINIKIDKLKGVTRDESNALIRLADSFCGFIRDMLENGTLKNIYKVAVKKQRIIEV